MIAPGLEPQLKFAFAPRRPDPRVWLAGSLSCSLVIFITTAPWVLRAIPALLVLMLLYTRLYRQALVLAGAQMVAYALVRWGSSFATASLLHMVIVRFLPLAAIGQLMMANIRQNELLLALSNMRIPKTALLPVAVMIRFLPTLGVEMAAIRDNLKLRGLEPSLLNLVTHPMRTMETFLVPLLMRSLAIADELSASALCRGIDAPIKRSGLTDVQMRPSDWIILMLLLVAMLALLTTGGGR